MAVKLFKSSIGSSLLLFILQTGLLLIVSFLIFYIAGSDWLKTFFLSHWLLLLIIYSGICCVYVCIFNNDVALFDDRVEIINRTPVLGKKHSFSFGDIEFVTFHHNWMETFAATIKPAFLQYIIKYTVEIFAPANYKWIEIKSGKVQRFYCFGIESDYYENESEFVFENLFTAVSDKGVAVYWANDQP
jgi:hypothetical protein